jgi:hypothetical protein
MTHPTLARLCADDRAGAAEKFGSFFDGAAVLDSSVEVFDVTRCPGLAVIDVVVGRIGEVNHGLQSIARVL